MSKKLISVSLGALLLCAITSARLSGQTAPGHDAFYYMTLMNKASAVMLAEGGIVPPALGGKIARGIQQVEADQAKPGARRPADYLVFEADLLNAAGPDASRLHTGRSRQDMGSTSGRMFLREGLLDHLRAVESRTRAGTGAGGSAPEDHHPRVYARRSGAAHVTGPLLARVRCGDAA